jgi:hypothetical protein
LEAYRVLEGFADRGKVHNLGVSNIYDRAELEWLISQARVPVKVVQNRWYEGNGWDWDGGFESFSYMGPKLIRQFMTFVRRMGFDISTTRSFPSVGFKLSCLDHSGH